jgi:hypothetical protein
MSLQDKGDLNTLRKQNEEFSAKISKLTKETEILKVDNADYLSQIMELKDQVDND